MSLFLTIFGLIVLFTILENLDELAEILLIVVVGIFCVLLWPFRKLFRLTKRTRLGSDVVPPPNGSWSSTIYTAAQLAQMERNKT